MPEAPIETNTVTSEATVTTTEPENIDLAAQAYTTIAETASGQLYMRATRRTDYANSTLFNSEDDSADYALALCEGCTLKIENYINELMAGTEQIG